MDRYVEQLKAVTDGRFRILTEETGECFEIICLDQSFNLVTNRRISRPQLQNKALMAAVYNDLRTILGCR